VGDFRLNVGCGEFRLEGFVNIDVHRDAGRRPDILADGRALPFRDGSVREIYAGHLVEHLDPEDVPVFLAEARRVLAPGGTFWLVIPDLEKALQMAGRGELTPAQLRDCVFGRPDIPGQAHRSAWTESLLALEVLRAGFKTVGGTRPSKAACPYLVSEVAWQAVLAATKEV
jgi:SAM-dependent methyltransferase